MAGRQSTRCRIQPFRDFRPAPREQCHPSERPLRFDGRHGNEEGQHRAENRGPLQAGPRFYQTQYRGRGTSSEIYSRDPGYLRQKGL